MTTVVINEKYRVKIDELNHVLEQLREGGEVIKVGAKKGQISESNWYTEGYYPNLQQCLRRVMYLEATLVPDCDLNGYIAYLERLESKFNKEYK